MIYPKLAESLRLERLTPPEGTVHMVLDTDTYNEIDDQFAVVYALLSKERVTVEAIYAAPFHNERSTRPADGMEKSYDEVLRLLERLDINPDGFVFHGSRGFLSKPEIAQKSDAARDLIERALSSQERPLYVVTTGAITNVASAILLEPTIVERIVVIWLGGQPQHWPDAVHFNLKQDVHAARVILDSGVPLIHMACDGVASHMLTTVFEIEHHLAGRGAIGDYLAGIFRNYFDDHYGRAKVLWDISTVAWLVNPSWIRSQILPCPVLTEQLTWRVEPGRHAMREALFVNRNAIFQDLFRKVERHAWQEPA